MNRKRAFTLAEVLITLGIIGIVASLTMPGLMSSYQKEVATNRLKKSYSVVQNAIKLAEVESGDFRDWPEWDYGNPWYGQDLNGAIQNRIMPNVKAVNFYPRESGSGNVGMSLCGGGEKIPYNWLNRVKITVPYDRTYASLSLVDGTCIGIATTLDPDRLKKSIVIDINGSETKPNRAGIDLFYFTLFQDGQLLPEGYDSEEADLTAKKLYACNTHYSINGGMICAAKVMRDGWKMKSDYPWLN